MEGVVPEPTCLPSRYLLLGDFCFQPISICPVFSETVNKGEYPVASATKDENCRCDPNIEDSGWSTAERLSGETSENKFIETILDRPFFMSMHQKMIIIWQ
jgi:hypothetical protein